MSHDANTPELGNAARSRGCAEGQSDGMHDVSMEASEGAGNCITAHAAGMPSLAEIAIEDTANLSAPHGVMTTSISTKQKIKQNDHTTI